MKKTFNIEVDCANCANLIEDALKKVDGIGSVVISYMSQKMTVEFSEGANEKETLKKALKTAKKIESDFEIEL